MKRKIIWLLVSCLMVLSLVLASCAPTEVKPVAPTTEKPVAPTEKPSPPEEKEVVAEGPEMVKVRLTKLDGTLVEKMVEKPEYGGVVTQCLSAPILYFDETLGVKNYAATAMLTNEELVFGDWSRGPAGTGEAGWVLNLAPPQHLLTGQLAETWEFTGPDTVVFKVRKNVYFHNKPPTNGRKLTAHDIEFSLKRTWTTPSSYHTGGYPWETHFESITAPDNYTLVVSCKPGKLPRVWAMLSNHVLIIPRDMVEKYGDMSDWENACGTGPFMLTDYVAGSSATLIRNPNYWQKDPLLPEYQLPYLDGIKYLIIQDTSTRLAALRTGKIDQLGGPSGSVGWEDGEYLIQRSPQLKYIRFFSGYGGGIFFNNVHETPPYNDIKVRWALSMAINRQEIKDDFYGGNADILCYPAADLPVFEGAYVPLEELPQSVRELYEYHPDKAKQLLAEAGYPNGFKTEVVCNIGHVDMLSIIKAYWDNIGVDMEIQVKEAGVYSSMGFLKSFKHMYDFDVAGFLPYRFLYTLPGNIWNQSQVDDPKINEALENISPVFFDETKKRQIMSDITPYMLEQVYHVTLPGPYNYTFWQPWLKGYHGEIYPGYSCYFWYLTYVWLDLDLKEEMTGTR